MIDTLLAFDLLVSVVIVGMRTGLGTAAEMNTDAATVETADVGMGSGRSCMMETTVAVA